MTFVMFKVVSLVVPLDLAMLLKGAWGGIWDAMRRRTEGSKSTRMPGTQVCCTTGNGNCISWGMPEPPKYAI